MKNEYNLDASLNLNTNKSSSLSNCAINELFDSMRTKTDFIELLNNILIIEFGESYKKKFTIRQINYFLSKLAGNKDTSQKNFETDIYYSFEIKKKSGGTRIINAPINDLELLLHCLNILIKSISKPHPKAFGFVEGKSIVDGAKNHSGKNYVYNIDLKDFFHSFDLNKVKMGFYNPPFNLKDEREPLAYMLACLVTYTIEGKRVLPQGSPASPSITNLLCWRLDHRLSGLAKRFGVEYTRYADDITFSSNHNCYKDNFITELKRIIKSQGLSINPKKTRLQSNNLRQEVTGLTVNNKVNVSKKYLKDVRMYLYFCEQYGIEKATKFYEKDYRKLKIQTLAEKPPSIELFLKGKLNYLSMVKGKDDSTYLKLESRFSKLFDRKIDYISSIIELWEIKGIDTAREKFYADKKNTQKYIKENIRNKTIVDIKDQSKIDEKIVITNNSEISELHKLWKELFNIDLPYDTFKNVHSWQFETDRQLDLAFKKSINSGNQKLLKKILESQKINVFLENFNSDEEKELVKDFLLNYIEQDFNGLKKLIDSKGNSIETLNDQFVIFKTNPK